MFFRTPRKETQKVLSKLETQTWTWTWLRARCTLTNYTPAPLPLPSRSPAQPQPRERSRCLLRSSPSSVSAAALAQPYSLHLLRTRPCARRCCRRRTPCTWCSRPCTQMLLPPHSLQSLSTRLCSQMRPCMVPRLPSQADPTTLRLHLRCCRLLFLLRLPLRCSRILCRILCRRRRLLYRRRRFPLHLRRCVSPPPPLSTPLSTSALVTERPIEGRQEFLLPAPRPPFDLFLLPPVYSALCSALHTVLSSAAAELPVASKSFMLFLR